MLEKAPPFASDVDDVDIVDAAITGRYANRFFLTTPVDRKVVHDILDVARWAPSGANIQPWRVYVLAGHTKSAVSADILRANETENAAHAAEYKYYCADLPEPYRTRRKRFGIVFYGALGINPSDHVGRSRQTARNYEFFGAPVGLIFTIDRRLEVGSWIDFGMFLQNIMTAAKARGLDTCAQETFAKYHRILRRHLSITPEELVVCGMSLGFADPAAAKRRGRQEKLAVEGFSRFFGFEEEI